MRKIIVSFFVLIYFSLAVQASASGTANPNSTPSSDRQASSEEANVLQYLSCETGYISDMVSYGHPYSCIDEPLLDQAITSMLTIGQSLAMTVRLKMNHEQLYPKNCARSHRADYRNPKISFGFCNNVVLLGTNILQLIKSIGGAAAMPPLSDYIIGYDDSNFSNAPIINSELGLRDPTWGYYSDGHWGLMADLGFPTGYLFFTYKVQLEQDKICVNILTLAGNFRPVGCKYIKEPFPKSIYETEDIVARTGNDFSTCNSVYNCSENAKLSSRAIAPILSPIIACVREMILRLVISTEVCNPTQLSSATSKNMAAAFAQGMDNGSIIHKFQRNMQKTVMALLTLYVLLFGFKVVMGGSKMRTRDVVNFILKFLLVTYFSVGINMHSEGRLERYDGISQFLFPLMLNGVTEIASWVMGTATFNGLCEFPASYYNSTDDINMSLWDQIDCRLAYYIGYDALVELLMGNAANDPVNHQVPPYLFMLVPAIIVGNEQLIMMALTYPIMILSFVAYALCMFISSLILILILGVMAPIFVPCALFEVTSQYFTKWWKTLLGLVLQPAIALTFMSLMFAVYDRAFYGTCVYNSVTIDYKLPDGAIKKYNTYFITLDSNQYRSAQELNSCTSSLGYFLNNPLQSIFGSVNNPALSTTGQIGGTIEVNPRDPQHLESMPDKPEDYMDGTQRPKMEWTNGLLTQSPKMFWEQMIGIIKNFIVCFIMLTVLKNLMDTIVNFITSLSGSEVKAGGTFDPGKIQGKLTEIAGLAAGAAAGGMDKMKAKSDGGEDSKESNKEEDKVSGGKKRDKVSSSLGSSDKVSGGDK